MNVPKQTGDIFEILNKGQFICSNSTYLQVRKLFEVIEEEDNYDILYRYFFEIKLILEKGEEYYYFSRNEAKVDLERKLEIAFKWIDIIDFLKTYDNAFTSGYSFTASDILVKLKVDAVLKSKLDGLKKWISTDVYQDSVNELIKMLGKDGFIEPENEILKSFKVLSSFRYLENLIASIHIPEEVQSEIPE